MDWKAGWREASHMGWARKDQLRMFQIEGRRFKGRAEAGLAGRTGRLETLCTKQAVWSME